MNFFQNVAAKLFKSGSAAASPEEWNWEDHALGTLYGNCAGDAIGLLTEFMIKEEAKKYYGKYKELEYDQKVPDMHRDRWKTGDWTDDSDQMIVIMESLLANDGKVDPVDFGQRLFTWSRKGYPELGDHAGLGLGATTSRVINHPEYKTDPHKCAEFVWDANGREIAPNGAVMRTSILGVYQYDDLNKVAANALNIGKTTHHDPRCQASVVAVTTAIALMLQRRPEHVKTNGEYNIKVIINKSFEQAQKCLRDKEAVDLLKTFMYASTLKNLKLGEPRKIGYTYKCMGSGFWALRQNDFRKALTAIVFEAGDADTNGAVAGALLGCKLGFKRLPESWVSGLKHKDWLQEKIDRFLQLVNTDRASRSADDMETGEENSTNVAKDADIPDHGKSDRKAMSTAPGEMECGASANVSEVAKCGMEHAESEAKDMNHAKTTH